MKEILTISELTREIKITLEEGFPELNVVGEISNFKPHVSGHWYFSLKDANAQISCTMWRGINNYVFFTPQDGIKIVASGRITVYPPRGSYQLEVRSMKPAGEGELQAAFEKLKKKLASEGLFDDAHKKSIPKFPRRIGIVTAVDGAAFKDMISVAQRRYPLVELVIVPARVQGEGAAVSIANAIRILNKQTNIDVIIIGRGGGSLEDLWAFNEEIVARTIYNSRVPIISGVGHEIDFTIADFTADIRAATPTAAMEIATPNKDEIFAFIDEFSYNSTNIISNLIEEKRYSIEQILSSYGFRFPADLIKNRIQFLDNIVFRNNINMDRKLVFTKNQFTLLSQSIQSHDMMKILKKGYTIVRQGDEVIRRAANMNVEKSFSIKFFDNEIMINKNE
ncbi:MAG: exodeoxyribonuclease VII large subunit [bacterium]